MVSTLGNQPFNPGTTDGQQNWELLKRLAVQYRRSDATWADKIVNESLRSTSSTYLHEYQTLMLALGFRALADRFEARKREIESEKTGKVLATLASSVTTEELRTKATHGFSGREEIPQPILSSVQLSSDRLSLVMRDLGEKSAIFDAVSIDDSESNAEKYKTYLEVNNFLKQWLGKEPGSKNDILVALKTPKFTLPKDKKGRETLTFKEYYVQELTRLRDTIPLGTKELTAVINKPLEKPLEKKEKESKELVELSKFLFDYVLSKGEAAKLKIDYDNYQKAGERIRIKLDEWQANFVTAIAAGQSILVVGPTSGGKTFASMSAINNLLSDKETSILYSAPTFHLAQQTYANLCKTFPEKAINLVTGVINSLSPPKKGGQIWVGTPIDLWSYLSAVEESYNIGIFDEVHTMSTSFGEGKEAEMTAYATANLMTKCREQIILLSATIADADVERLSAFAIKQTGIQKINLIKYRERTVPLYTRSLTPDFKYGPAVDRMEAIPVTAENTFHFATFLRDYAPSLDGVTMAKATKSSENHFPAIIFDDDENSSFQDYQEFVEWLYRENQKSYLVWQKLHDDWSLKLDAVNDSIGGPGGESVFIKTTNSIVEALKAAVTKVLSNKDYEGILISTTDKIRRFLRDVLKLTSSYEKVPIVVKDLIEQYERYFEMTNHTKGRIPAPCSGPGPFFSFGDYKSEFGDVQLMIAQDGSEKARRLRDLMQEFLAAEAITSKEAEKILKVIDQGLQFGIGIILPNMPFIIQYEMLNLLNSRSLYLVFASRSMSMGVNYAIRTAVIRAKVPRSINVSEILQMQGRAGRRNKDTIGVSVMWNVANAASAKIETLPEIVFPETTPEMGSMIRHPLEVAVRIEVWRLQTAAGKIVADRVSQLRRDLPPTAAGAKGGAGGASSDGKFPIKSAASTLRISADFLRTGIENGFSNLATEIGFSLSETLELVEKVCRLATGETIPRDRDNVYFYAEQLTQVKRAVQELHTRFHRSKNVDWLKYLQSIFEILHTCTYKQLNL
jgi:hypothetical protein